MNVVVHQEKKNEKTGRRREKTVGQFQRGCVPSCGRLEHREKNGSCEGSARGNWDPRKGQKPFRLNPNGVGDHTTTLRRMLIGAGILCSMSLLSSDYRTYK